MNHNEDFQRILDLIPGPPDYIIDWDALHKTHAGSFLRDMKKTEQNPAFHGEGNVYNHTRLVCETLASLPEYRALSEYDRQIIFVSALFHDIGKIRTTRMESGRWTSPNHAIVGAEMMRELLWVTFGLSGDRDKIVMRESICNLVRYHMIPVRIMDEKNPVERLYKIASPGELAKDYTLRKLCLLSQADVSGRYAGDIKESIEKVELCRILSEEKGCIDSPKAFASSHTKRAYFSGRNVLPEQALYDDTWGEVIVLSGLPGTGKDTWIQNAHPDMPTVSLDDIRESMQIAPTDNQGRVVQAALEEARIYLRKKKPFIWNATNLTRMTREKVIRLSESYGASVRIVYLETDFDEQLRRNASRKACVPESVIAKMLSGLQLPEPWEAAKVEWLSV